MAQIAEQSAHKRGARWPSLPFNFLGLLVAVAMNAWVEQVDLNWLLALSCCGQHQEQEMTEHSDCQSEEANGHIEHHRRRGSGGLSDWAGLRLFGDKINAGQYGACPKLIRSDVPSNNNMKAAMSSSQHSRQDHWMSGSKNVARRVDRPAVPAMSFAIKSSRKRTTAPRSA